VAELDLEGVAWGPDQGRQSGGLNVRHASCPAPTCSVARKRRRLIHQDGTPKHQHWRSAMSDRAVSWAVELFRTG
jgi:hypothetical protein